MSDYIPDRWMIIGIHSPEEIIYKVFACWYGGFAGSDSWKLNSGITAAAFKDPYWEFEGASGSVYSCHKTAYGISGYGRIALNNLLGQAAEQGIKIDVLDQETFESDWDRLFHNTDAEAVPVLENEELWSQRVIDEDRKIDYKN